MFDAITNVCNMLYKLALSGPPKVVASVDVPHPCSSMAPLARAFLTASKVATVLTPNSYMDTYGPPISGGVYLPSS
jgi:hypothetical protein